MPLLPNLPYTNLNKYKFGDPRFGDRPGGGWSKQPFITTSGLDVSQLSTEDLSRTGGPDMFLRGGYLVPGRVLDDEKRLLDLFTKSNRGLLFTAQQNLLSALGVRIYGGYPQRVKTVNLARLNDGTYTPLSTAAAIAGTAFGIHPNKQGIDPTGLSNFGRPEYIKLVDGGFTNTGSSFGIEATNLNRLVNLFNTKILKSNSRNDNPSNLYSYLGGPQAGKNGLGKTYIKVGSDSPTRQNGGEILRGYGGGGNINYSTFSQTNLDNAPVVGNSSNTTVQDFRKTLIKNFTPAQKQTSKSYISTSPDYLTKNIETRVGLGDPGKRGVDRSNYTNGRPDLPAGLDTVNSLYLYDASGVTSDIDRKNDLVKFRVAVINNDNPSKKTFIHFRSFIDSFSDSMDANWNEFNYLGRGEKFFNYNGFSRSISMKFTVVAQSVQELSIMYQKLNYLMSHLAPDYSKGGYMRGNLVQLTLGGYLYETPGIITSLTYDIPNDTTWEIGIPASQEQGTNPPNGPGFSNSDVKELPHRIEVAMSFKPIHNFLPQKVGSSYSAKENPSGIRGGGAIKQRFISLEDAGANTNNLYNRGIKSQFIPNSVFGEEAKKAEQLQFEQDFRNNLQPINDPNIYEIPFPGGEEDLVPLLPENP